MQRSKENKVKLSCNHTTQRVAIWMFKCSHFLCLNIITYVHFYKNKIICHIPFIFFHLTLFVENISHVSKYFSIISKMRFVNIDQNLAYHLPFKLLHMSFG